MYAASMLWVRFSCIFSLLVLQRLIRDANSVSSINSNHQIISSMKNAAIQKSTFTQLEVDKVIKSIQNLVPSSCDHAIPWNDLSTFISKFAHEPHTEWVKTERGAKELESFLSNPNDGTFRHIFHRVLKDGNWDDAVLAKQTGLQDKPWVVLITGLNGIRKTTSTKQPWFQEAIRLSLGEAVDLDSLPSGRNSFFRQLDYIIATIANEDFKALYQITDIDEYVRYKDAIFARYRTLAEMIGVVLVKAAIGKRINVLVETSGRDIAMFEYVDAFFSSADYRKLVVHFTINNLQYAEQSVDSRMRNEVRLGAEALAAASDARLLITFYALLISFK